MKTIETENIEKAIRKATRKMGTFGCFEVTIGNVGSERVDYITYDTKKIWRCYEIKVTKADFRSPAAKSFVGHYNYYVMTGDLYDTVRSEIPECIGVYVGGTCVKKAKRQQLLVDEQILKDSMIRSLYRDSDKLLLNGDENRINRLKREAEKGRKDAARADDRYHKLYWAIREKYGREEARNLAGLNEL